MGAQTVILASHSPEASFTSIDISAASLAQARDRARRAGAPQVTFQQADLYRLPYGPGSFDHVFVCFVLEHLRDPVSALAELRRVLRPGGTFSVIEGDHGSAYFHPDSDQARRAIQCLIDLQRQAGGDALIGRQAVPVAGPGGLP